MRRLITTAAVLALGLAAAGCEQLMVAQHYGAAAGGRLLIAECQLSPGTRQLNRDAVTAAAGELGSPARAVAQDCDGDGAPDF